MMVTESVLPYFFKGCPLKCVWCHNPETQRFEQEIQYDREKCTGCGACAQVCPNHAITMEEGRPKLDKKLCTLCGKCENFCTQGIREIVGQKISGEGTGKRTDEGSDVL